MVTVQVAAIDMERLAAASAGTTPMAVVDRAWLRSIHDVLAGKPYVDVSAAPSPAERHVRIMTVIETVVLDRSAS